MARKKKESGNPPAGQGRALAVRPHGRPTVYDEYHVGIILERLAAGESLRRICAEDESLPAESTVRNWAVTDKEGFFARYARARDIGLDCMADEMLDIADDGANDWIERERRDGSTYVALDKEAVMRSALRCDIRKWYLARMAPKRYGALLKLDEKPEAAAAIEGEYVLVPDEKGPRAPIL